MEGLGCGEVTFKCDVRPFGPSDGVRGCGCVEVLAYLAIPSPYVSCTPRGL